MDYPLALTGTTIPIQRFHAFTWGVKAWHAAQRNISTLPELSECATCSSEIFWKTLKNTQIADAIPPKNTEFPIRLQKDILYKKQGKNQLSWTIWSEFEEQFFPVSWKLFWKLFVFTWYGKWANPKKYKNFISAQNFPEDPNKNTKIRLSSLRILLCAFYTLKIRWAYLSLYYGSAPLPPSPRHLRWQESRVLKGSFKFSSWTVCGKLV